MRNYYPALLLGMSCHLLIMGLDRSIGERIAIPFIRTSLYGFGLIFFGIGFFIRKFDKMFFKNIGVMNICAILLLFALSSCIPITVINWDTIYSALVNRKTQGALFNLDGIISLTIIIISAVIFLLWLGNRFGILLKNSDNPILILFAYTAGFLLTVPLAIRLIPRFGPAALLILSTLLFFSYLWVETRKIYIVISMILTFCIFLIFSYKDFSRASTLGLKNSEKILTAWSPYNRLDFVRSLDLFGKEWLLASYNFSPVWVTSPDADTQDQMSQFPIGKISPGEKILIIGGGGGFSSMMFLRKNPEVNIVVNEIDPEVIRLMKDRLSKYNNNAYNDPRVEVWPGEGSLILEQLAKERKYRFDKIIYEGTDSTYIALPRSLIPIDCYLYTREAFENIYRLLKPKGIFLIYITATRIEDISHIMPAINGLFHFRLTFTRLSSPSPSKGHPYCFIVAAKSKQGLIAYLKDLSSKDGYNFVPRGGNISKDILTYDRPIWASVPIKVLLAIFTFLTFTVSLFYLNLARKSEGWNLAIPSFLLGIGYIFVELLMLDKISRSFLAPALGQSVCISLFLFGQIIAIYLMSQIPKIKSTILVPSSMIGPLFLLPVELPYSIFISMLWGFACGICFPYILRIFKPKSVEKLYGLDMIGSVTGSFAYFLTVFIWGFQTAAIIAITLYAIVVLILFLSSFSRSCSN
jgi:spermidine synthase